VRYEIRCYEHPHRNPSTPEEAAANAKARELKPPEWPPIVVTARGWDDAKRLAKEEIAKRGRVLRGIHIGTDKNLHAYVFTAEDSKIRPQKMRASDRRYPAKR
jgi:hypothetical protein